MASALNTKINSYAIQNGIEFDQSITLPPTQTGTLTENTPAYWSFQGRSAVYEPGVGPAGGSGSWKYVINSANGCRLRNNGGPLLNLMGDGNISVGFWFKTTEFRTTNTLVDATALFAWVPAGTTGFGFFISGGAHATPNRLVFKGGAQTVVSNTTVSLNTWYYLAVVKNGNTMTFYINGQAANSVTSTSTSSATQIGWSDNVAGTSATDGATLNISNSYIAEPSVIGATQIAEIWAVGSTAPATVNYSSEPMTASALSVDPSLKISENILETPATATALMTEPTIVTTVGDSTYVTTSFIASATFPSNVSIVARKNINFTNVGTSNASAIFGDNVIITAGTNVSYSSEQLTASALMNNAKTSESPFVASALMKDPIIFVTPNYYNLIKSLNPYLYINNGQSSANIVNYGYQSGTFVRDLDLLTNQNSPFPLDMVAEGKSWRGSSTTNSNGWITFETANFANSFNSLVGTGNFAYEIWVNPQQFPSGAQFSSYNGPNYSIINSEKIHLYMTEPSSNMNVTYPNNNWNTRSLRLDISNSSTTTIQLNIPLSSTPLTLLNWNHIVINIYQSGINANQRLVQLWINGQIVFNQNISFTSYVDNTDKINYILGSNASGLKFLSDMYYDELAIYSSALTNSQIIQHYNFISTLSPNYIHNASSITANAESGNHQYAVTSNINAIATSITGSADFVMPSVLAQKVINYSAPTLTASALNTDATVYYGWTIYPVPAIAAAESKEGFALNTTYYDYIQANIAPYRYVTFDTATPFADYGTDTDYAVNPTVVGGIIVNPDVGITGKSAKTAGLDYTTDGVILKESEHDDNWGTGNNSWHSSFWMERAIDDNSTTGLRVLWNLNGHNDNQNVILYHYQNKLHLQINNQVGAPITITSANNVNIFDYTRHNIVINSHHNNNNNVLYVYVDATLVLTQNIGSYAVTTINNPIHVGANDEANNFPRLGVGCLITPFVNTALPVVPTNTKLILDEIYWDKNQILQTAVTNIFNVMPDKVNANTVAEALIASAEMIMPTIITNAILSAVPATASTEFVNPSLYIERFIVTSADIMDASALMANAIGFVQVTINADVMAASVILNNAGILIAVPGPTMYASAQFADRPNGVYGSSAYFDLGIGIHINGFPSYIILSPWAAWLRTNNSNDLIVTRELV